MNYHQHLKQLRFELLYLTVIFFVILIASGSIRVNASLKLLDPEFIEVASFSAYISLTISCIFYIGITALLFLIINLITQYHKSEEEYSIFLEGIFDFIITLCVFEIIKVAVTFMFFKEALLRVTDVELINEQLRGSTWWKCDKIVRIIAVITSTFIFFISCYKKKKTMRLLTMATFIIFFGTVLIIFL